jgi:hypothetical protein
MRWCKTFCLLLQDKIDDKDHFIEIPGLSETEVSSTMHHWLTQTNRTLTQAQMEAVTYHNTSGFKKDEFFTAQDHSMPLFWKLRFEDARKWTSYEMVDKITLGHSILHVSRSIFARLLKIYGRRFAAKVLAYITVGAQSHMRKPHSINQLENL